MQTAVNVPLFRGSEGYRSVSRDSSTLAIEYILWVYWTEKPAPREPASSMIPPKTERNLEILHRYRSGERAIDLAMHYGISVRRVNRLIHKFESKER